MAYFITKADVIDYAFSRDIEEDRIQDNLIESCGIRYLMPILGEDFYDAVVLDPDSYVALNVYLVALISNYVKYEILPDLYTEVSTAGLNQFLGENKRPAVRPELAALRQNVLDTATLHSQLLYKYLEDNEASYPLYVSGSNPQNKVVIAGGIVFDLGKTDDDDDDYTNNLRHY